MAISATAFRHGTDRAVTATSALTGAVSAAASVWIFCLMLLICADIAGRTLLNQPVQGSRIAAKPSAIVFLRAAHTLMVA